MFPTSHFDILDDLAAAFAEDDRATAPEPLPPPRPARVSAAALAAEEARAEAERKRRSRAAATASGIPDPRAVDLAVAAALAQVLARNDAATLVARAGTLHGLRVHLTPVLRIAGRTLVRRGYDRQAVTDVLRRRFLCSTGSRRPANETLQ